MQPDTVKEFFLYRNNEPLREQKIADVSFEPSVGLNSAFCLGGKMCFGQNLNIAGMPIKQRYLIHCFVKGWRPSVAGLLGFIRLSQLGYYKRL